MKTQSVWTPRPLPGLVSASSPLARCRAAGAWPRTGPLAQRWARACALALSPGRSGPPCGPQHAAAAPERTAGVRPRPPRGRQDRCCVSRALCDRRGSVRGPPVASGGAQLWRRRCPVSPSVCVCQLSRVTFDSHCILQAVHKQSAPAPPVCPRAERAGAGTRPARTPRCPVAPRTVPGVGGWHPLGPLAIVPSSWLCGSGASMRLSL